MHVITRHFLTVPVPWTFKRLPNSPELFPKVSSTADPQTQFDDDIK